MPYPAFAIRCKSSLARLLLLTAFWRRSFWHQLGRLLLWMIYANIGLAFTLLAMENRLLFHPLTARQTWAPPPTGLVVEDVALQSTDGTGLHGWWSKPEGWQPGNGAVLYLHGKGGNLSSRGPALGRWRETLRLAVLIIDYPGYGQSKGSPTEAGCYAAGDAAYNWLTQTMGVPGQRIVLLGGSLGGGIATELATHHPHRALVLIATFTSFPDMAQKTFPWLPGRWLVHNQLDNLRKIATLQTPVFIAHGTSDGLIPFGQARRLFAAANQPKQFFPMAGQHHSEVPSDDCFAAVRAFLEENDSSFARAN